MCELQENYSAQERKFQSRQQGKFRLNYGDKILLCTDGLYNLISDEEIWQMVKQSESLQKAADQLIETALLRGGFDNITLILYEHEA